MYILLQLVHFILEAFDVQQRQDCTYDYLIIASETNDSTGPLCGTLPSNNTFDYVVDGNVATVTFSTDEGVTASGFSMFYEAIPGLK